MAKGYLNQYFSGVAAKKLSSVEMDSGRSNQHEFNGSKALKELFGTGLKTEYTAIFLYLTDDENVRAEGKLTWYDSRANHPIRSEWRMYYPSSEVTEQASPGDSLFICKKVDNTLLVIIAAGDSIIESQLYWLFDIQSSADNKFEVQSAFRTETAGTDFVIKMILDELGIESRDALAEQYYEPMLERFHGEFPKTKEFSEFARSTVQDTDSVEEPDDALIKWFNREWDLFKLMEKYQIEKNLRQMMEAGNGIDVQKYIAYSLSVQNRRKSRAGYSLENHISKILEDNHITYSRTPVTENKARPDFIFPGIDCYNNLAYPVEYLTMLGAKSTCKDRWRQVLSEAERIDIKHLLTLEAAISENQIIEMKARNLQLVVPLSIHSTYSKENQNWLYSVKQFIAEVKEKQAHGEKWLK